MGGERYQGGAGAIITFFAGLLGALFGLFLTVALLTLLFAALAHQWP